MTLEEFDESYQNSLGQSPEREDHEPEQPGPREQALEQRGMEIYWTRERRRKKMQAIRQKTSKIFHELKSQHPGHFVTLCGRFIMAKRKFEITGSESITCKKCIQDRIDK